MLIWRSRRTGRTYTILSRVEALGVFALAHSVEIARILDINKHDDGPMRDEEMARVCGLAERTGRHFDFLDSPEALVALVRLVDLWSADGLLDSVCQHCRRRQWAACQLGPWDRQCLACQIGACELGAEQLGPSPSERDAYDMALASMPICNCAACRTARSLLERLEVSMETFRAQCLRNRDDCI